MGQSYPPRPSLALFPGRPTNAGDGNLVSRGGAAPESGRGSFSARRARGRFGNPPRPGYSKISQIISR